MTDLSWGGGVEACSWFSLIFGSNRRLEPYIRVCERNITNKKKILLRCFTEVPLLSASFVWWPGAPLWQESASHLWSRMAYPCELEWLWYLKLQRKSFKIGLGSWKNGICPKLLRDYFIFKQRFEKWNPSFLFLERTWNYQSFFFPTHIMYE